MPDDQVRMEFIDVVYHGTTVQGLKYLEPYLSTHKKRFVYASCSIAMAALFIPSEHGDYLTKIGLEDKKKLYIAERLPNILVKLYKNLTGSIYELDGKQFHHMDGLMSIECVSSKNVPVKNEITIPDVLNLLYEFERKGLLSIYKFDNLPSWIPTDKSDLVEKSVQWTLEFGDDTLKSLKKFHPELVDIVIERVQEIRRLKNK